MPIKQYLEKFEPTTEDGRKKIINSQKTTTWKLDHYTNTTAQGLLGCFVPSDSEDSEFVT